LKYLIVNADDFGANPGINRGIIEAHRQGILTSVSLMVNAPASEEVAALSCAAPALSVGLHLDVRSDFQTASSTNGRVAEVLRQQFERFTALMGRPPTHLDSHHNVHRQPEALPFFLELARQHDLPLREHSSVVYFSKFYGQWGGATHPEQISAANLARMLETEIGEGITELSCHPGYVDDRFRSGYAIEREMELRALCDLRIRPVLAKEQIQLVSYNDIKTLSQPSSIEGPIRESLRQSLRQS
jgi:predicted glycoside hydrolase/deacetylase ChbG (UPF0249 family)